MTGLKASIVGAIAGTIGIPLAAISYMYGPLTTILLGPLWSSGEPPSQTFMMISTILPGVTFALSQLVAFISALVVITILREAFSRYDKVRALQSQLIDKG